MIQRKPILGPTYLEGITEDVYNYGKIERFEWRKILRTASGQTKFKINYYGNLKGEHIVETAFAPQKVVAIDNITGEEILLFDGCIHGYNAMFCDEYSKEQIIDREVSHIYVSNNNNTEFEVVMSAYYQIDYDEEFREEVNEDGMIQLKNGSMESLTNVKRNGFDVFQILLIDGTGKAYEAITEELA